MPRKLLWKFGLILASSLNYTGALMLNTFWHVELYYYLPIVFLISTMLGILTIDLRDALIYTCISLVLSAIISVVIVSAPPILFGESSLTIDAAVQLAMTSVTRLLIFGIIICIVGTMLGCFLGEVTSEQIE